MYNSELDVAYFNNLSKGFFPEKLGIVYTEVKENTLTAEMPILSDLFAPHNFLHGGSIVSLADTVAGYSTLAHLPENGKSFTTLELKTNFIGAAREGILVCKSNAEHLGRTTQIWDVIVTEKNTNKKIALFTCTQLILY